MNGLTDDMKRFLLAQTLMGAAQPMLAASAPSTDPRNKSFGYALSQGIGGMQQGQQQGMAGIMARMQMEDAMKRRAAREQLAGQIGQPPQQGIASMMGGGTMLDSGQVLPQGQTMMGNRVVPQGLAGLIGTPEFADAMKLYTQEPQEFGTASAGDTIYSKGTGEVKGTVPEKKTKDTRKTLTVQIGDEVVEVIESETTPGQYEIMKIDGKEVRGLKKPMVEVNIGDQEKEKERKQSALTKASIIVEKVDDALSKVDYLTTGVGGTIMGKIPGTEAVDLEQILETIRAQIGFNELSEMRRQSPTGGALGQVAVRELELLSATLGSLDRRQSPEQLKKSLTDIKTHYLNWKKAVEDSKGDKKSSSKSSVAPTPEEAAEELRRRGK